MIRHVTHVLIVASVAFAGSVVLPAKAADPTVEDGQRAYDEQKFTDALGVWGKLSNEGNAQAAYGLGLLYDLGNGVAESQVDAFHWYSVAAAGGVPQAQLNVAIMYDSGRGVARSAENAAIWYAKAAAHGMARAEYNLGILYAKGEGVPQNVDMAKVWFTAAQRNGVSAAADQIKQLPASRGKSSASAALTPVQLQAPPRNAAFSAGRDGRTIELVWTAPPQPTEANFVLRVWTIDGNTMKDFYSATSAQSSLLLQIGNEPAFYAWNVEVSELGGPRKAVGASSWFFVEPTARPSGVASRGTQP